MNKILNNKKLVFAIIAVLLVIVVVLVVVLKGGSNKNVINDLKVKYSNGEEIKFKNFKKSFTEKRTITVENTSDENRTYSLEWADVSNTLKKQNVFTYTIKGEGDRAAELGKSQVPVAGAVVFTQVLVEAHKTQTYTIEFKYDNSKGESDAKFNGKLKVYSEVVDKKKIEAQEKKERERMEKEMEEQRKADEAKKSKEA